MIGNKRNINFYDCIIIIIIMCSLCCIIAEVIAYSIHTVHTHTYGIFIMPPSNKQIKQSFLFKKSIKKRKKNKNLLAVSFHFFLQMNFSLEWRSILCLFLFSGSVILFLFSVLSACICFRSAFVQKISFYFALSHCFIVYFGFMCLLWFRSTVCTACCQVMLNMERKGNKMWVWKLMKTQMEYKKLEE